VNHEFENYRCVSSFVLLLICTAAVAQAQSRPLTLEFIFTNPGARSLGLGGAFAAFADDATAAFANPAGLVQITRPEVSFELRGRADVSSFTVGAGGQTSTRTSSASGVGFLSFVYPRGNWRIAFYRHQFADVESLTALSGDVLAELSSPPLSDQTSAELSAVTYAVSGAYRLKDSLRLGFGLSHFSGDLTSTTEIVTSLFGPTRTEVVRVNDSDWGVNAGILWSLTKNVNVGGFYRQAPSFSGEKETLGETGSEREKVRFPDVFGAGMAFKSNSGSLAASVEWDHVRYSLTGDRDEGSEVDDGDEIHLGFEYVFLGITPIIGFRTGVWHDPGLRVHIVPEGAGSRATYEEPARWHYAFGLGFAFRRFQLDLGVDVSGRVITGSLSGIINF
jgi:long-chain fatty acid transport protein